MKLQYLLIFDLQKWQLHMMGHQISSGTEEIMRKGDPGTATGSDLNLGVPGSEPQSCDLPHKENNWKLSDHNHEKSNV